MTQKSLKQKRHLEILKTVLGEHLLNYLVNDDIIEIMANPDGKLWLDTLSQGKQASIYTLTTTERLNIIKLIASLNQLLVNEDYPEVACELQPFSARFQAWIFPVSAEPTFTLRKKAQRIFSLEEYVRQGALASTDARLLKYAVEQRLNIIIAGGTGSGKTTFINALLYELKDHPDRVIVLEDLPELQMSSPDHIILKTTRQVTMRDLVKGCLRMRPDRIIIGEVRDGTALDMLKAWNTGHPGGFSTLHANRTESILSRLEDLILEVTPQIPQHLIQEAVDLVVFMQKQEPRTFVIREIKFISEKAKHIFNCTV